MLVRVKETQTGLLAVNLDNIMMVTKTHLVMMTSNGPVKAEADSSEIDAILAAIDAQNANHKPRTTNHPRKTPLKTRVEGLQIAPGGADGQVDPKNGNALKSQKNGHRNN